MTQTNLKRIAFGGLLLAVIFSQMACQPTDLSKENMIPKPVSVVPEGGEAFDLTDQTNIYVQGESAELKQIGQFLADKLNPSTGLGIEVKTTSENYCSREYLFISFGERSGVRRRGLSTQNYRQTR